MLRPMGFSGYQHEDDLTIRVFLQLRHAFFNSSGETIPFHLRDKRNTQDDPLDEHIAALLQAGLSSVRCARAPGPLTTPDLVMFQPDRCQAATRSDLRDNLSSIVAIEVKKLERVR